MKTFAWVAGAAVIMALTPGAALAAKPDKAKGPKPKAEAKVVAEPPAKAHAQGGKKAEPKAPAKPERKAPGKAEPRGKAYGHAREEMPAEAPPPPAPKANKARSGERPAADRPAAGRGKVTLCHATGSATNPYVVITVSVNATTGNGHGRHADDVIPARAGSCETTQPRPEEPGNGGGDPGGGGPGSGGEDPQASSPDPKADRKPGGSGDRPVLVNQPAPPADAAASPAREELPFTGLPLALVALLGAAALGTGLLLRRKGRPSGSTAGPASR